MNKRTWIKASLLVFLPSILLALILGSFNKPKAVFYSFLRETGRVRSEASFKDFESLEGDHFLVRYLPSDENVAGIVLSASEEAYGRVVKDFGYEPKGKTTIVIYPDRESLRKSFGWSSGDSALGVYWEGIIRLLSPNAWAARTDPAGLAEEFRRYGPITHEFTHLVLDYRTAGNYPHWFSEGLAQWEEYRVTGYLWVEPENTLYQDLYSLKALENEFDGLSNVALAYRESYLLTEYLFRLRGLEGLNALIKDLEGGESFKAALQDVYHLTPEQLQAGWLQWLGEHIEELENGRPQEEKALTLPKRERGEQGRRSALRRTE